MLAKQNEIDLCLGQKFGGHFSIVEGKFEVTCRNNKNSVEWVRGNRPRVSCNGVACTEHIVKGGGSGGQSFEQHGSNLCCNAVCVKKVMVVLPATRNVLTEKYSKLRIWNLGRMEGRVRRRPTQKRS